MKKTLWLLALIFCSSMILQAESLWDEGFNGYLAATPALSIGHIVTVYLDSETRLSFTSTGGGDKEMVLEFSGGETDDLFSFLPQVRTSRTLEVGGEEEISLQAVLAARVQEFDDRGLAYIQGSRSMTLQGAAQAVTVTGWVHPKNLDRDRGIPFSRLADGNLTYRTLTEAVRPVLTRDDIITVLARMEDGEAAAEAPEAAPAAEEEAAPAAGEAEGTAAQPETGGAAQPGRETIQLTEERKRELLLDYINRMVDLIFQ